MFLVCMTGNRHSKETKEERKKERKKRERKKKKAGVSFGNNENIEKSARRVRLRNDEKETPHHTKLQLTFQFSLFSPICLVSSILLVFFNSFFNSPLFCSILVVFFNSPCFLQFSWVSSILSSILLCFAPCVSGSY